MAVKLSSEAFRRFYELHAWAGVVTSLVLYVMFLAGGFTLFHEQLERWEEPLAQRAISPPRTMNEQLSAGLRALGTTPQTLWFGPGEDLGEPHFNWQDDKGEWQAAHLDSATGALVMQRERLAHFTHELHYLWHDATGYALYYLAGLLSLVWLLVIVSGVLVHLKDLVRQFHQFRPKKQGRLFWSDLHKVLSVMGLPFQTVFAYSGAFMVLGPLVAQLFVKPVFAGDLQRATRTALGYTLDAPEKPGAPATPLTVDALHARIAQVAPDLDITAYRFINHGFDNGIFEVWGYEKSEPHSREMVQLNEVTGELLTRSQPGAMSTLRRWVMGLHFAQFGGLPVRVSLLLLTLASCLAILSGNWLWLSRRSASPRRKLSRLTVGVGAGAWVAFGALLFASRALPLTLAKRGTVEELLFLGALVACMVWAGVVRDERTLWWRQLAVAAGLWLAVPFLAAVHSTAGLFGAGPRDATVVGVDVTLLLCGVGLAVTSWAFRPTSSRARPAPLAARDPLPAGEGNSHA